MSNSNMSVAMSANKNGYAAALLKPATVISTTTTTTKVELAVVTKESRRKLNSTVNNNNNNNNNNNKNKKNVPVTTPYCATCHKAGKTIDVYTGHWTKSSPGPEGVVVCPLILSTVCKTCNHSGHWAKYCPTIASSSSLSNLFDDSNDNDSDTSSISRSSTNSFASTNSRASDILKKAINVGQPASTVFANVESPIQPATDKYNYTKKNINGIVSASKPEFPPLPPSFVMSTPVKIPTASKIGENRGCDVAAREVADPEYGTSVKYSAPVKQVEFTPVTPDSTPPTLKRRLWADMEDDE